MSSRIVPTEVIVQAPPPEPPPRPRGTFSALHHSAFRWYFSGQLVSLSGTWMQSVAQQIVVYNLTGSQLALGLVACAQGLPALILTPFAGVLVERLPRRRILLGTQITLMLLALSMALLMFAGTLQLWHIIVLSLGIGVANALDAPARLSFLVEMVGHEDLPSSIVLNSIMFNTARIFGPALGGVALATVGPEWCFLLNGLSFLAVIVSLAVMRLRPVKVASRKGGMLRPLLDGLRFARRHEAIAPLLVLSALASSFGLTFVVLIPPFADTVLRNTEIGTSALLTAQGIGALFASAFVAWANRRGMRGRLLVTGAILGPVAVMLMAVTTTLPLAALLVGLAGFAFVCQFVLQNTLIQTIVPDEYRGRVLSLYTLSFFGLSPFGSLIIGTTAQAIGTVPAILFFGCFSLCGAVLIVWRSPQLARLP